MNFTVIDCDQRSQEWRQARLGRLTGSRAADMCLPPNKDGSEKAGRRNLRLQLVLERITSRSAESGYQSQAMRDGIEREPDALAIYEAVTGRLLQRSGFLAHTSLMAGCSLDGHIGDFAGIVEIKAPIAATHLGYLRTGVIPDEYLKQITHALWITGAEWCDWLSYCPDFPEPLQVKLVRVQRTAVDLKAYELLVRMFLAEVDREFEQVSQLMAEAVA